VSSRKIAEPWSEDDFSAVAALVRARHGSPLLPHRLGLLRARLRVRLAARGIPSFTSFYDQHLHGRSDGPDMQLLIDLGTVNHTSFFREPGPLGRLADDLVDRLRVAGPNQVRVWSAGCSAGQEPYSLAMLLAERIPLPSNSQIEILASDVSLDMVQAAAQAIYDARLLTELSNERLRRFFLRGRDDRRGFCRVSPEVRRLVSFRHFDLRSPEWPVPGGLDAILCRNVLIYFSEPERVAMLDRFAARLRDGGLLAVGSCEILAERPRLLAKVSPSLFRKVAAP
jgi:chemotaxis protein methyltransferase CheR